MSMALVQKVDDDLIDTLMGKTSQAAEAIGGWTLAASGYATLSLSNTLVLDYATKEVYSGGNTYTVDQIDYFNGKIRVYSTTGSTVTASTTPAYWYSALSYATDATTATTFDFIDVVNAQYQVKGTGRLEDPDTTLLSPRGYQLLLKNPNFVRASYAGDNSALRRGIVGNLSGMTSIVSTKIPSTAALIFAKDRFTKMVDRPVYTKRHDNPASDGTQLFGYARFGVKRVFEGAAQLILNLASDSANM